LITGGIINRLSYMLSALNTSTGTCGIVTLHWSCSVSNFVNHWFCGINSGTSEHLMTVIHSVTEYIL